MSTFGEKIAALQKQRSDSLDKFKALAEKPDFKAETDQPEYDRLKKEFDDLSAQIDRVKVAQELDAKTAQPIAGQERMTLPATVESDPYQSEQAAVAQGLRTNKGLIAVGMCKAMHMGAGVPENGIAMAKRTYGERHPVTLAISAGFSTGVPKALQAGIGASGGAIIPPHYVNEIIELLRPAACVRAAGPRTMPMPRGTMTLPAQTAAATAGYGSETGQINASQQQLGDIVAVYKKLTALVPITNDLLRYADPAADAFVRDDLVKIMALREDLSFIMSDGTNDNPKGFLGFANAWVAANGGTVGSWGGIVSGAWSSTANSTAAAGGNFITSTEGGSATLTTTANELAGMVQKLDGANVPDTKRRWFFNPRIFNYLNNLLNSLGVYVYRDELSKGTLLGYPFSKTNQIPVNVWDATGANKNCTFIFLVEMDEDIILDSMTLELAVSREGTYYDTAGTLQSAFQKDQTLIRAIAEHDHQVRHLASIAVDQFVTWAPASA